MNRKIVKDIPDNTSSDDDSDWTSGSEEETIDLHEYRKFISKIFPSRHARQRVRDTPKNTYYSDEKVRLKKRHIQEEEEEEEEEDSPTKFKIEFHIKEVDDESEESDESDESDESEESEETPDKSDRLNRKHITSNIKKFKSFLHEKNMMNDVKYFKDKLNMEEQSVVLTDMKELIDNYSIDKPYRLKLLGTDIPLEYKVIAYKKINTLDQLEPSDSEYYKIKQWVDTFMQIPFGKYKQHPITLKEDGIEKCSEFMENAKQILDKAVYGMNDMKLQIMQMIGQWVTNPSSIGTAIAIKGPMGTGKTTIVKDGISKVLGRNFSFITLGGATDASFLEGHSYTYEGSTWGKIIDHLIQCKYMNPVFFFDELDKVSDTPRGEEIIGILTHLTDTTQNSKFHDKYFAELDFDLSRCLFIFSYNDESKINPILLDRMYRVQTNGYDTKEKIVIARDYLIPKIREQVCFDEKDIIIPEDTMGYIITNYTDNESGVRNLKRCLETIYTKINLFRLLTPNTSLFESMCKLGKITYPYTVTVDVVNILLPIKSEGSKWNAMYL